MADKGSDSLQKPKRPYARKGKSEPVRPVADEMFGAFFSAGGSLSPGDVLQISFEDGEGSVATHRPQEFLKTGDRISNNIVKGFKDGEAVFKGSAKTSRGLEPFVTRVSFSYKNVGIMVPSGGDKGFTSLDKEVHDAVVSLYAAGNMVFSPAMVYRTMAGKADSSYVHPEKLGEITASIYKCMSSIITIDAGEEAPVYGMEALYSQNLIYAKAVTLKTKGWEVSAFMLIDEPVLFRYAKMKRQVFSVPLRVLDTPPSKTNDVIVLQGYLLRIVESLRRPGTKVSDMVLYSSIYELLDEKYAAKQKLLRIRARVKSILNYWIDIGYIGGYMEIKKDKSKYAIQIRAGQAGGVSG